MAGRLTAIAVAGALGALARYAVGRAVGPQTFPWPTLGINVVGSFLLGLVVGVALARRWPDSLVVPITIGFLGAFTTFSTFAYETFGLLRDERAPAALAYVSVSVGGGVLAAAAGYVLARGLAAGA